jgi:hypothetical protein
VQVGAKEKLPRKVSQATVGKRTPSNDGTFRANARATTYNCDELGGAGQEDLRLAVMAHDCERVLLRRRVGDARANGGAIDAHFGGS